MPSLSQYLCLILKKFGIESRQKEGERELLHVSAEL